MKLILLYLLALVIVVRKTKKAHLLRKFEANVRFFILFSFCLSFM